MPNRFGAPYDSKKSPVSREKYYANVSKSRKAMDAAGPRPKDKAGRTAWAQKARKHFKTAYDCGYVEALEKLGMFAPPVRDPATSPFVLQERPQQSSQLMRRLSEFARNPMGGNSRKTPPMFSTGNI